MTWSSKLPRAVMQDLEAGDAPAVSWAPDEIGGGTRRPLNRPTRSTEAAAGPTIEAIRDDAFARGYEEGIRAGEAAEAVRLRATAVALQDALESVQLGVDRWVGNAEENIAAISVAIARHIIGREVIVDRSTVVEVIRLALAEFPLDQAVTVRLHPSDMRTVVSALSADPIDSIGTRRENHLLADARVAPGGCIVEGRDRIVDGRVDIALERVYRRLTYTGA
jgi:flagellar biosynthesis/type III secretory pathway protein FliH